MTAYLISARLLTPDPVLRSAVWEAVGQAVEAVTEEAHLMAAAAWIGWTPAGALDLVQALNAAIVGNPACRGVCFSVSEIPAGTPIPANTNLRRDEERPDQWRGLRGVW